MSVNLFVKFNLHTETNSRTHTQWKDTDLTRFNLVLPRPTSSGPHSRNSLLILGNQEYKVSFLGFTRGSHDLDSSWRRKLSLNPNLSTQKPSTPKAHV